MRLDTCTKRCTTIDNFTCICIAGIATIYYEYDTDVAGYLRIEAFAMAPATTACGPNTVTLSYEAAC